MYEGEVYYFEMYYNPIRIKEEVQGVVCLGVNITQKRKSQEKIRFQANILENVKDSVIVTDLDGKIIFFGKSAEQTYGYTAEEALGKPLALLAPEEDYKKMLENNKEAFKQGIFTTELKRRRKTGEEIWVEMTGSIMRDTQGKAIGFIGVSKNITERKIAEHKLQIALAEARALNQALLEREEELSASEEELKQLNYHLEKNNEELLKTNRELDRFVYSTSHDLRAHKLGVRANYTLPCDRRPPGIAQTAGYARSKYAKVR